MFPRTPGQPTLLGSSPSHPAAYRGFPPAGPLDTPNARRQEVRSISFPSPTPTPTLASQLETSVRSVPSPAVYWLWRPVPSSSLSPSFVSLALPWFGPLLPLLISELEMSLCFQFFLSFPHSPPRFVPTNTTECALVRHPYPNPALPSGHCPISLSRPLIRRFNILSLLPQSPFNPRNPAFFPIITFP